MGTMAIMGVEGDTKLIWDKANADEVKNARRTFDDLINKGFRAYSVKDEGKTDKRITSFDPEAQKVILIPAMAGG